MTIEERRAREAYDRENPWRPMSEAKVDGLICELLINDMGGFHSLEGDQFFLDADGHWYGVNREVSLDGRLVHIMNWRPAYVRLTPERRAILRRRAKS